MIVLHAYLPKLIFMSFTQNKFKTKFKTIVILFVENNIFLCILHRFIGWMILSIESVAATCNRPGMTKTWKEQKELKKISKVSIN